MSPALMIPDQRVLPRGARTGKPFIMSANLGLAPGQQGTLDAGRLRNVYRQPFAVTELRFTASAFQLFGTTQPVSGDLFQNYNNFGGWVSAQIQASGHYLTNGFVPIWMLGKRYWQGGEYNDSDCVYYRWVLPRPMVLMPNTSLEVDLNVNVAGPYGNLTNPITTEVAACGHTIDGVPDSAFETSYFPWASAFEANSVNGVDLTTNTELSLNNPFRTPLRVQRLIGRLGYIGGVPTTSPDTGNYSGFYPGVGQDATFIADGDTGGPYSSGVSVALLMQDSSGYKMNNLPTPMSFLFYPATEWTFDKDIMPNENLSLVLTNNMLAQEKGNPADAFNSGAGSAFPMIGLLGSRVEDLGSAQ